MENAIFHTGKQKKLFFSRYKVEYISESTIVVVVVVHNKFIHYVLWIVEHFHRQQSLLLSSSWSSSSPPSSFCRFSLKTKTKKKVFFRPSHDLNCRVPFYRCCFCCCCIRFRLSFLFWGPMSEEQKKKEKKRNINTYFLLESPCSV